MRNFHSVKCPMKGMKRKATDVGGEILLNHSSYSGLEYTKKTHNPTIKTTNTKEEIQMAHEKLFDIINL